MFDVVRRRVCGAAVLVLLLGVSTNARAEDDPYPNRVPLAEIGGLAANLHVRPTHPATGGGDADGAKDVSVVLRAEISIIGLLLDLGPLRLGDYIGIDFGPDIAFGFSGRWVIGAQAAYEISKSIGAGARVYSLTAFDPLMSSYNNMVNGELTGRVGAVIGRVRFPVAQGSNAGYAASDYGASLRLPTSWRILGYGGWKAGVDYDYFAYEEATGDAVVHRLSLVVALGI